MKEEAQGLRPADIPLCNWEGGVDVAMDLTICHGWQASEQDRSTANVAVTREHWRSFLRKRESAKHAMYGKVCSAAGWSFRAMAFCTWGGMGPEGSRLLHQIAKRAAGWLEGDLPARRQEEFRHAVGVALIQEVWTLLERNNYL
jgi:hypothetical protein